MCGDGKIEANEECDEGTLNGEGFACSSECVVRCSADDFLDEVVAAKDDRTTHCYVLVNALEAFENAANGCRARALVGGFRLASPRTLAELNFVRSLFPFGPSPWVGLRDLDPNDGLAIFDWVDGSPRGFIDPEAELWGEGEPDDKIATPNVEDGEEECISLGDIRGYLLSDASCGVPGPYLCEYSPAPL